MIRSGDHQTTPPCGEVANNEAANMLVFRDELTEVLRGTRPFAFHFQPVVDLHTGVAVGYEALVRFGGSLGWTPDRWFQAAGELGLRTLLETLVISRTFQAARQLSPNTFLSINVGPDFLLSDEWDELLEKQGSLARIVVEITEQDVIRDYQRMQQKIAAIHARGGTVGTDDVGSGYASLKHVMEIRPDFVKLDRAFVDGCHLDPARAAMIEMIGTVAGRLDAWIIAEGVETQAELEELIRLDVPLAQGYYLGRPAPQMRPVSPEVQQAVRATARAFSETQTVKRALESCAVRLTPEEGMSHLEGNKRTQFAMVIDGWRRPRLLVELHPLLGMRRLEHFVKVQIDSAPLDVLQRALARPLPLRFDPLIAINERGEFLGLLRVDRLMSEALHNVSHASPLRGRRFRHRNWFTTEPCHDPPITWPACAPSRQRTKLDM
jgi:EAL domain-containing protein (putative c-di-GMP-specific phosphodiesterase class I)